MRLRFRQEESVLKNVSLRTTGHEFIIGVFRAESRQDGQVLAMTKALADERLQRFVSVLGIALPAYVPSRATRLLTKGPGSFLARLAWLTGEDRPRPATDLAESGTGRRGPRPLPVK